MAKKQKKKLPVTKRSEPTTVKFKQSRVETARLIRRFHILNKELAKCQSLPRSLTTVKREADIMKEMEQMGGIDWYQKASQLGQSNTRGGNSSKWLIPVLKAECKESLDHSLKPIQVLDVGAVAPDNYKSYSSWIKAKPIDLNPQHDAIQQQDFLKMMAPVEDKDKFDIVSLSLVINFVGDPKERGQMLVHSRDFLSSPSVSHRLHYLFLVVPLACITNSRYMTHEHLLSMMESIGYSKCIKHHYSNKLAYYLFELESKPDVRRISWKKKLINEKAGGGKNNFAVVIE